MVIRPKRPKTYKKGSKKKEFIKDLKVNAAKKHAVKDQHTTEVTNKQQHLSIESNGGEELLELCIVINHSFVISKQLAPRHISNCSH